MEVLKLQTWKDEFNSEVLCLDKLQEYLDFIIEARDQYDPERYSEWHHVMPKCIDKDKKYIEQGVRINGADHFRAHLKLVECFTGSTKSLLSYALMRMKNNVVSHGETISPEDWESAVALYAKANSERSRKRIGPLNSNYGRRYRLNLTESQIKARKDRMKGNHLNCFKTPEIHKRMSEKFTGEGNPFYGRRHTEETKEKISKGRMGEKNPAYKKVWMTNGEVDRRVCEEEIPSLEKQGYRRGRIVSETTRLNMSKSHKDKFRDEKGRWISNE